jgi:hypothetical protein
MQALYDYVIQPLGERYNNEKSVGDKNLILNSEIYNHEFINRKAVVVSTPKNVKTELKAGDIVIVHHNVFRRWYNVKGVEKNSRSYFKEDKYFVKHDQIFAYQLNNKWRALKGYCFVKPIKSTDKFSEDKEKPLVGIVKYTDGCVDVGDLVGFVPSSEYEFVIDGERLYRVMSKFITIKYEYQGDEEEYNPSWA